MTHLARRQVLLGLAGFPFVLKARAAEPAIRGRQFHNQPEKSHQHSFLVEMWQKIQQETDGKVEVTVFASNNNVAGGDPAVLDMLVKGEVEFFTLMGGLISRVVPSMDIQGLPFAFQTSQQVHDANDGALGEYLSKECAAKGIHRFQYGLLENGFRQISTLDKPIRTADDLTGLKIRVPNGKLFQDLFTTLGAQPVALNLNELVAAFKDKRIDGQENPLVVTDVNKLYEYTNQMSITNHSWTGFNLIANLDFWKKIPAEMQQVIDRNVKTYVAQQRAYVQQLNRDLEPKLKERGMVFTVADTDSFRRKLAGGGFYQRWRTQLGETAWTMLEEKVGKLG